jgi:hypothetical protein
MPGIRDVLLAQSSGGGFQVQQEPIAYEDQPYVPPVNWDEDELNLRAELVHTVNPDLANGDDLWVLANLPVPTEQLTSHVLGLMGHRTAQTQAEWVRTLDAAQQRALWDRVGDRQRNLLRAAGYGGPPEQDKPWWQDAINAAVPGGDLIERATGIAPSDVVTRAGGLGMAGAGRALAPVGWVEDRYSGLLDEVEGQIRRTPGVGGVLGSGFNVGVRPVANPAGELRALPGRLEDLYQNVTQTYRAWDYIGLNEGQGGNQSVLWESIVNPTVWGRAWSAAEDGERYYRAEDYQEARAMLGGIDAPASMQDTLMDLAVDVAAFGNSPDLHSYAMELLAERQGFVTPDGLPDLENPEFRAMAQPLARAMSEQAFTDTVRHLQESKVSLGRDVARMLQFDEGSDQFSVVSGAVDLGLRLATDPTLWAGRAFRVYRASRYAFAADDAAAVAQAAGRQVIRVPTRGIREGWRAGRAQGLAVRTGQPVPQVVFEGEGIITRRARDFWVSKFDHDGMSRSLTAVERRVRDPAHMRAADEWAGAFNAAARGDYAAIATLTEKYNANRALIARTWEIAEDAAARTTPRSTRWVRGPGGVDVEVGMGPTPGVPLTDVTGEHVLNIWAADEMLPTLVAGRGLDLSKAVISLPRSTGYTRGVYRAKQLATRSIDFGRERGNTVAVATRIAQGASADPDFAKFAQQGADDITRLLTRTGRTGKGDVYEQLSTLLRQGNAVGLQERLDEGMNLVWANRARPLSQEMREGKRIVAEVADDIVRLASQDPVDFGRALTALNAYFGPAYVNQTVEALETLHATSGLRRLNPTVMAPGGVRVLKIPTWMASFLDGITTHVPRGGTIRITDPSSADEIGRVLEMGALAGIPSETRAAMLGEWITGTPRGRYGLWATHHQWMADIGGLQGDALDDWMRNHNRGVYSRHNNDWTDTPFGRERHGIFPEQMTEDLPVPNFQRYIATARLLNFTTQTMGRMTDGTVAGFMGKVWTPAVLLRGGFIMRASADELLAFIARYGPKAYLDQKVLVRAAHHPQGVVANPWVWAAGLSVYGTTDLPGHEQARIAGLGAAAFTPGKWLARRMADTGVGTAGRIRYQRDLAPFFAHTLGWTRPVAIAIGDTAARGVGAVAHSFVNPERYRTYVDELRRTPFEEAVRLGLMSDRVALSLNRAVSANNAYIETSAGLNLTDNIVLATEKRMFRGDRIMFIPMRESQAKGYELVQRGMALGTTRQITEGLTNLGRQADTLLEPGFGARVADEVQRHLPQGADLQVLLRDRVRVVEQRTELLAAARKARAQLDPTRADAQMVGDALDEFADALAAVKGRWARDTRLIESAFNADVAVNMALAREWSHRATFPAYDATMRLMAGSLSRSQLDEFVSVFGWTGADETRALAELNRVKAAMRLVPDDEMHQMELALRNVGAQARRSPDEVLAARTARRAGKAGRPQRDGWQGVLDRWRQEDWFTGATRAQRADIVRAVKALPGLRPRDRMSLTYLREFDIGYVVGRNGIDANNPTMLNVLRHVAARPDQHAGLDLAQSMASTARVPGPGQTPVYVPVLSAQAHAALPAGWEAQVEDVVRTAMATTAYGGGDVAQRVGMSLTDLPSREGLVDLRAMLQSVNDSWAATGQQTRLVTPLGFADPAQAQAVSRAIHEMAGVADTSVVARADVADAILATGRRHQAEGTGALRIAGDIDNEWVLLDDVLSSARPIPNPQQVGTTTAGFPVLDNLATYEQARDAQVARQLQEIVDDLRSATTKDEWMHEIIGPMLGRPGREVDASDIALIDPGDVPNIGMRPTSMIFTENLWDRIVAWGFEKVISPAIDAIIRQPLYFENLYLARQQMTSLERLLYDDVAREQVEARVGAADQALFDRWFSLPEGVRANGLTDDGFNTAIASAMDAKGREIEKLTGQLSTFKGDPDDLLRGPTIQRSSWPKPDELDAPDPADLIAIAREELDDLAWARDFDAGQRAALIRWSTNKQYADDFIANAAAERAVGMSIPYIDDQAIRSQFQVFVKPFVPFQFAEEQFIKRWAKTIAYAPDTFRKAQLTLMGLREVGIIRKNEYGEDVYVIPGTGPLIDTLVGWSGTLFGGQATFPSASVLTGSVRYSVPGLDRYGIPSVSPLVAMPIAALRRRFPELGVPLERAIVGPRAGGTRAEGGFFNEMIRMAVPTHMQRFYDAALAGPNTNQRFANAMVATMAHLAAADQLPDPDETDPMAIERTLMDIEQGTRITYGVQAALGFFAPATPTVEFEGDLSDEFLDLLRYMDYGDAYTEFLRRHPGGDAWTIFGTTTESKRSVPATQEAFDFLTANETALSNHPLATAWAVPEPDANNGDEFMRQAWHQQFAYGIRDRRDPEEMLREIIMRRDGNPYYDMRERYERHRRLLANDPEERARLDFTWTQQSDSYLAQHPLFSSLREQGVGAQRREAVRADVLEATLNGALPNTPRTRMLRQMIVDWQQFQDAMQTARGRRDSASREFRQAVRTQYLNRGIIFIRRYPEMRAFWETVLRPDIGIED